MRTGGERLYYDTPAWNPYDLAALQRAAVPQAATHSRRAGCPATRTRSSYAARNAN